MRIKILLLVLVLLIFSSFASAAEPMCATYFTGIGCPHCAKVDPTVLPDLTSRYDFIVIEYEIYQSSENAPLIYSYDEVYDVGIGIPLIIFGQNASLKGDKDILTNLENLLEKYESNKCPLPQNNQYFSELDFNKIPGKPKIWGNNRIIIREGVTKDSGQIAELMTTDDIAKTLQDKDYTSTKPEKVPLSGESVEFEHAVKIEGWKFQWNGESVEEHQGNNGENGEINGTEEIGSLSMSKIISLAAVDAINPCALAVLTLILLAIITHNPKKRKTILQAGLAFTFSVFILYLIYGLIIIKFFQLIQVLTSVRLWLYTVLGVAAIILGLLNIKDFFRYKPGGIATEMPLSLRPKMKKLVSSVTSPKGAFIIGAFVTLFLLPCTIGPYIIASGILSVMNILKTLPWLLLYNFVFVLPMLIITLVVYYGITKVEDVSGWKEKNIRYLHLISGLIILALGLAMIFGWI